MTKSASIVLVATLLLAACGGGGGGAGSSAGGAGFTPSGSTAAQAIDGLPAGPASIEMTNALGSSVQTYSEFESDLTQAASPSMAHRQMGVTRVDTTATCTLSGAGTSFETWVPDQNGDPNSTEVQSFYDTACSQLWRDTVRLFSSTARDAEVVTSTEKTYALGLPNTPVSTKTDVTDYSQTSFTPNTGYPSVGPGYLRSSTGSLYVGSTKTIIQDYELVMGPQSSTGVNDFCSDDAGFSLVQVDTSNGPSFQSYGWNGTVNNGASGNPPPPATRTQNPDGSVTWSSAHNGEFYSAVAGAMSIAAGESNTACPISTPQFAITGGTQIGQHSIPVVATFHQGLLTSLTIAKASVGGDAVLNVSTSSTLPASNPEFITGSVTTQSDFPIASFNVDAAGDGTLNVASSSVTGSYTIVHWHVVNNPSNNTPSLTGRSK